MTEPLQSISDDLFFSLKHPLQPRRFMLALFFALLLFPLIATALVVGTVFVVVPFFGVLLWLSGRVLFANFLGNSILVSDLNYPRINGIAEDLKAVIGYQKPVNVFVYEQGNFNAFMMKFFFYRRAVFLNSELLETGVSDDELRWLIGRFIGYLRARRKAGFWGWTIRAAQKLLVFNLFLLPYERALVYTGDRIALAVINGDIGCAVSAMQKLFVGRQLGYSVNPNGLVDQHRQVKGSFFAFLARISTAFPHMTARYVDLIGFAKERYPASYERFEADNPGLPIDLKTLTALPEAVATEHGKRDPVWASLAGALAVLGLFTLLTVKLILPEYARSRGTSAFPFTPAVNEITTPAVAPSAEQPPPAPLLEPASATDIPATTTPSTTASDERFVSRAGRFSIAFPGTPTKGSQRVPLSANDAITLYQFSFESVGSSYLVMYNDYPAQYVPGEPQLLLKGIRDASVKSMKCTLTEDEAVTLKGVPGRAWKCSDAAGINYVEYVFLDGERLYQVIASAAGADSGAQAEAFLDSFRIVANE